MLFIFLFFILTAAQCELEFEVKEQLNYHIIFEFEADGKEEPSTLTAT